MTTIRRMWPVLACTVIACDVVADPADAEFADEVTVRGLVANDVALNSARLNGVTMNGFPRQCGARVGLEPALAVAVVTIDPALAGSRRLAGLQQALLLSGSGSGRRSRRLGRGIGREQVGEGIRSGRRRETCDENRGEPKSQRTGHVIPPVLCPAPKRPLAAT